jgi:hypothetical protein
MSPKGVTDIKTDRPTDRRSQHELNSKRVLQWYSMFYYVASVTKSFTFMA